MPLARDEPRQEILRIAEQVVQANLDVLRLVDRLLEGWAFWSRCGSIDLRPTSTGDLWKIQAIIDGRTPILIVTDDAFLLIDRSIAISPPRLKKIIFVEYLWAATQQRKWKKLGLYRDSYGKRLYAAHKYLSDSLLPEFASSSISGIPETVKMDTSPPIEISPCFP